MNEGLQWVTLFILLALQGVAFLTKLDDKWDILRPRYYKPPEQQQQQPRRNRGNQRRRSR